MENEQFRQIKSIHKVDHFMKQSAPRVAVLAAAEKRIDLHVARLGRLAQQQYGAHQMKPRDSFEVQQLAARLREHRLLQVARHGKVILRHAPGAERALKVPGKNSSPTAICDAAGRIYKLVRPHARLFVDRGLPKDFAIGIRDATRELRALLKETGKYKREHAEATAALQVEIRAARAEVNVIDALLLPWTSRDGVLRRTWEIAKRVGPRKGRPPKGRARPVRGER